MNLGVAAPLAVKTITVAVKFNNKRIQTPNCSPVHKIVKLFVFEGGDILLCRNRRKDVRNGLK